MKLWISFLCVILAAYTLEARPQSDPGLHQNQVFGEMGDKQDVMTLAKAMDNYKNLEGKTITLEATPKKVCEKKGCWMVLKDNKKYVRTFFKDYGFFVPKDILGKKVRVQGKLEKKHVSAPTLRHYMMDEGKKMEEVKKIKTGKTMFQFVATGVEVI